MGLPNWVPPLWFQIFFPESLGLKIIDLKGFYVGWALEIVFLTLNTVEYWVLKTLKFETGGDQNLQMNFLTPPSFFLWKIDSFWLFDSKKVYHWGSQI